MKIEGKALPTVVHLSAFDRIGGAGTMAYRLHAGQRARGLDSSMVVANKQRLAHQVYGPTGFVQHSVNALERYLDRSLLKVRQGEPKVPFSTAWLPDRQLSRIRPLKPDVIHLHWLGSTLLRIESLRALAAYRPLVWTLHDSWPFTGGCHVPLDCSRFETGCGSCPILESERENDLSRWVFRRKAATYDGLKIHFVAPSAWMAEMARSSRLLGDAPITVIPHGVDTSVFKPIDKEIARSILGWPNGRQYVLFGAVEAIDNPLKGVPYLLRALGHLEARAEDRQIELVVFGSIAPEGGWEAPFRSRFVGPITDEVAMALIYAAADVMVVPSPLESFGLTAAEAQACGTPVVAFAASGLLDVVDSGRTGFLTTPYLPEELALGVARVLDDARGERRLPGAAAEHAQATFGVDRMVAAYLEVYRSALTAK